MKKDYNFVEKFNLEELEGFEINFTENKTNGDYIKVVTPIDRTFLANIKKSDRNEYEKKITVLKEAENECKKIPAPQRGHRKVTGRSRPPGVHCPSLTSGKVVSPSGFYH